jgi:hypothetical protein
MREEEGTPTATASATAAGSYCFDCGEPERDSSRTICVVDMADEQCD